MTEEVYHLLSNRVNELIENADSLPFSFMLTPNSAISFDELIEFIEKYKNDNKNKYMLILYNYSNSLLRIRVMKLL